MATISILSAKGSPGVTTAVVAQAAAWTWAHPTRTALAVDADLMGGDVAAGVLRGEVPPGSGALGLATSRDLDWSDAIERCAVPLGHDKGARVLPGVPDAARAPALRLAWDLISERRADLHRDGCDVLVDAGRVRVPAGEPGATHVRGALAGEAPWLADSDVVVVMVRPGLPGVLAAHRLAAAWPLTGTPLHAVVLDEPSPYRPAEVAEAVGLPLLGVIPYDARSARVHSEGSAAPRGFVRSAYARGTRRVADAVGSLAIERAERHLPPEEAASTAAPTKIGAP